MRWGGAREQVPHLLSGRGVCGPSPPQASQPGQRAGGLELPQLRSAAAEAGGGGLPVWMGSSLWPRQPPTAVQPPGVRRGPAPLLSLTGSALQETRLSPGHLEPAAACPAVPADATWWAGGGAAAVGQDQALQGSHSRLSPGLSGPIGVLVCDVLGNSRHLHPPFPWDRGLSRLLLRHTPTALEASVGWGRGQDSLSFCRQNPPPTLSSSPAVMNCNNKN